MKPAPLQLTDYFITKLNLEANPDYDLEGKVTADLDTIDVTHNIEHFESVDNGGSKWRVIMVIKQIIPKGRNIPYKFELELQGEIFAFPIFKEDRLATVVNANAPAMLFGAAREIIRAATGRGPFPAVVIPSTNFLPAPQKKTTKKTTAKKAAKKQTAARKAATKKVAKTSKKKATK